MQCKYCKKETNLKINGQPYCNYSHYARHQNHLVKCAHCGKAIEEGTLWEDGRPYCDEICAGGDDEDND